jgi:hypothetical protein
MGRIEFPVLRSNLSATDQNHENAVDSEASAPSSGVVIVAPSRQNSTDPGPDRLQTVTQNGANGLIDHGYARVTFFSPRSNVREAGAARWLTPP